MATMASPPPVRALALAVVLVAGCATAGKGRRTEGQIVIVDTRPAGDAKLEPGMRLRVDLYYEIRRFQRGRDRINLFFRTREGSLEMKTLLVAKSEGRVWFEFGVTNLLAHPTLVRPIELRAALARWESADHVRLLDLSEAVFFEADRLVTPPPNATTAFAR